MLVYQMDATKIVQATASNLSPPIARVPISLKPHTKIIKTPTLSVHSSTKSFKDVNPSPMPTPTKIKLRSSNLVINSLSTPVKSVSSKKSSRSVKMALPRVNEEPVAVYGDISPPRKINLRNIDKISPVKSIVSVKSTTNHTSPTKIKTRKVTQKVKEIRSYSTAKHKTIDDKEVDWMAMEGAEYDKWHRKYMKRLGKLKKFDEFQTIDMPEDDIPLDELVEYHNECVYQLKISMNTSSYASILSIFYYAVEGVMRYFFKMNSFAGFGKYQSDKMVLYNQALVEIGEYFTEREETQVAPHWKVLSVVGVQTAMFIASGLISNWLGLNNTKSIIGTLNDIFESVMATKLDKDGIPIKRKKDINPIEIISNNFETGDVMSIISMFFGGMGEEKGDGGKKKKNKKNGENGKNVCKIINDGIKGTSEKEILDKPMPNNAFDINKSDTALVF